ncbi:MAG: hypothetical protein JRF65_15050, partial [Deltaproteobacteria bacterium]|nr:hypothetical protein [Deltaproteobacteria bacterium]
TALSDAQNESRPSNEAMALSDRVQPRATAIAYSPQGPFDPATGRMGPGRVDVLVIVSEPLQTTPFLSITPDGGIPMSVQLQKATDVQYAGFFEIADTTPGGTAYAVFSARDLAGNRGAEVDAGATVQIDTDGPSISRLQVEPADPIRNDHTAPVAVTVTLGLTDQVKAGETPALSYLLSGPGRTAVPVDAPIQVTTQAGDVQTWQAGFTLPADAGLTDAEILSFVHTARDDLENASDRILCDNRFQVYQGDLPPLAPPSGLEARSLPHGRISLTWQGVDAAAGYQVYRKAPGEPGLTAYVRLGDQLDYTDEPSVDGTYAYAVAGIRQENQQEAISGMSATVGAVSDSVAPYAPPNLSLELVSTGILAQWDAPPYTEPVTYALYRSDAVDITSVVGLTPLLTGISETGAVDPRPSPSDHCYAVTAVDGVGNESAPSNSYYLNFQLLPVSTLNVVQADMASPIISWTHPGGDIAGYDIYLTTAAQSWVKLNSSLITGHEYEDWGYNGDTRAYTVIAKDYAGMESPGRRIVMPDMSAAMVDAGGIKRGIMNRVEYVVENRSTEPVANARLRVRVNEVDHLSETFDLDPASSGVAPVTIGGYADLEEIEPLTVGIEMTPNQGETVSIVRTSEIEVGHGMMVMRICNEEFTRGGTGTVWFTLENTGEAEIEIVTARSWGNAPSDEMTFFLEDADGNVLSTADVKQGIGEDIVTLSNGKSVARIPAGGIFTSASMT